MYTNPVAKTLTSFVILLVLSGCGEGLRSSKKDVEPGPGPGPGLGLEARYTTSPIIVDGWLDEVAWKQAVTYPLVLASDRSKHGEMAQEQGLIRVAWDDHFFYVAVEFEDVDIVAEGTSNQLPHYQLGDLCEVFLKPEHQSWYWELYVTPRGLKSNFWFPGRGRFGLPSNFQYNCGLRVAAQVEGSINNWSDKDARWTAEMAMPIRDLTAQGEIFGPGAPWRILVARYNYSRYGTARGPELTMVPKLSETNFHLLEEYTPLRLVR